MKIVLLAIMFITGSCFSFSGNGAGTVEDPFLITNVNQLQEMNDSLKAHFKLINDIDASVTSGWNTGDHDNNPATPDSAMGFLPVGGMEGPFNGSLNGSGHVISGLYINRPLADFAGLFGYSYQSSVDSLGLVNNFIAGNVKTSSNGRSGGLIGYAVTGVTVLNCYMKGDVIGGNSVGGLIGQAYAGVEVNNCHTSGKILGSGYVGGIIGLAGIGVFVNNSYSSSIVDYKGTGIGIGGIIGSASDSCIVYRTYFSGMVTGKDQIGGIIGQSSKSAINQCFNSAAVRGEMYVGGIVGYNINNSTVRNCYSTGSVISNYNVGGIAGQNYSSKSELSNCYSTSQITGTQNSGGVSGYNSLSVVSNCFWDTAVCRIAKGIGFDANNDQVVRGESSEKMKITSTFTSTGWDFFGESVNGAEDVWSIADGYPFLSFYTMNSFTLTYLAGDGGVINGNNQQTVEIGLNGLPVNALPKSGYTFVKWSDGRTDNPRIDYNVISDLSYTAEFKLNTAIEQTSFHKLTRKPILGNSIRLSVLSPYKARFYSINGKLLKEISGTADVIKLTNMGFGKGVYLICIFQGSDVFSGRFILE